MLWRADGGTGLSGEALAKSGILPVAADYAFDPVSNLTDTTVEIEGKRGRI